ncbi:MAG: tetratricopeptide repeat protein [Gemmatimonadota bacterium]|nr:tetratricopeptide repeat protein [Gemmatimonadota bacterium]
MYRYLIGLVVVPLLGFTFLDPAADRNRRGNRMFHEGRFEEALKYYREAQVENPEAPQLRFNAGDAYFKKNAYKDALQEFEQALKSRDPSFLARAYYNMGNVHVRQQNLQQAAEAYKRSLALRPDDLDAKVNLEWVLEKMREQEKNQEREQEQGESKEGDQEQNEEANEPHENEPDDEGNREQPDPNAGDNRDPNQKGRENPDQGQRPQPEDPDGQQQNQQSTQSESPAGSLSREEAERLLDAMRDREMKSQKYRRLRVYGKRYKGNEW